MPQYFYGTPVGPVFSYSNKMVEVTWAGLKADRDAGILVPGQQYRITNYNLVIDSQSPCGTSVFSSAGHQFDIIVTADSPTVLNENARAALHEGDTYFTNYNSKLASWELKYCLDNDYNRFNWATPNGKGVIYFMRDEFKNETGYDFKNALFKIDSNQLACYTFGPLGNQVDYSCTYGQGGGTGCIGNVIKPTFGILSGARRHLVWNQVLGNYNFLDYECYNNRIYNPVGSLDFGYCFLHTQCTSNWIALGTNGNPAGGSTKFVTLQSGVHDIKLVPQSAGTLRNIEVCSGVSGGLTITCPTEAAYKITVANPNDQTILVD